MQYLLAAEYIKAPLNEVTVDQVHQRVEPRRAVLIQAGDYWQELVRLQLAKLGAAVHVEDLRHLRVEDVPNLVAVDRLPWVLAMGSDGVDVDGAWLVVGGDGLGHDELGVVQW